MTWHGFSIPKLAPKVASSIGGDRVSQRREQLRGLPTMERPLMSRAQELKRGVKD